MKKNYGNVLWGILLIFIGLGLAGRYLLDWNFTLFLTAGGHYLSSYLVSFL